MYRSFLPVFLHGFTLATIYLGYRATLYNGEHLSPQGCRMSYMWPQYFEQKDFNLSWTPLANRYSLWLYREGQHSDTNRKLTGSPVLFIPGNSGSSRQVRSIASSAANQYFGEYGRSVAEAFRHRSLLPLDVFTADFNEDFSALHGPTLIAQRDYVLSAVAYILSQYPTATKIVLIGHSMGGVVAVSSLPHAQVAGIITLSSPHALPPARYSAPIETIYRDVYARLQNPNITTPILSICGGPADLMIPSETCTIPFAQESNYRRTIYSSGLEGCWTSLGHQVSVWCDQVRWRVARAVLELPKDSSDDVKMRVLTTWLSDRPQIARASTIVDHIEKDSSVILPLGETLTIKDFTSDKAAYLLPLRQQDNKFTLYVSGGSIFGRGPLNGLSLDIKIVLCSKSGNLGDCAPLDNTQTQLIPNPPHGIIFPVDEEGVTHSDGVIMLHHDFSDRISPSAGYVGLIITSSGPGKNWVIAALEATEHIVSDTSLWSLMTRPGDIIHIPHSQNRLRTIIDFPRLHKSALIVYRLKTRVIGSCNDALLRPVLEHQVGEERHFHFPLPNAAFLHSHNTGPFLGSWARSHKNTINIYHTNTCSIRELRLTIAYFPTFGRWVTRYFGTVHAWGLAIVKALVIHAWLGGRSSASFRSIDEVAISFAPSVFPLAILSLGISLIPLPEFLWLGNRGDPNAAFIAPMIIVIACGCVYVSSSYLVIYISFMQQLIPRFFLGSKEIRSRTRSILIIVVACGLIVTLIPYQVAFIMGFILHSWRCLTTCTDTEKDLRRIRNLTNRDMLYLLVLVWLLPNMAPTVAAWIRTIVSTRSITLFAGDHSIVIILPFLLLMEALYCSDHQQVAKMQGWKENSVKFVLLMSTLYDFLWGPRFPYMIFTTASIQASVVLACHWIN